VFRRLLLAPVVALVSLTSLDSAYGQFASQVISGEVSGAKEYRVLLVEAYNTSSHMVVERQTLG